MGLSTNDAVQQDVQIKPSVVEGRYYSYRHGARAKRCSSEGCTNQAKNVEECVLDMGRRLSVVAVMGATTMSSTEECALDTEQGSNHQRSIVMKQAMRVIKDSSSARFRIAPLPTRPRHKSNNKNQANQVKRSSAYARTTLLDISTPQ
eukprot:scaffold2290_cov122-Skeletonema_marinoi.AAC.6